MAFLRNVSLTLVANLGITALGLLSSVLLARTLGPVGRGLMATIILWPMMLSWASSLGLGNANAYFGAAEPQSRPALFANSFWAGLVLGLLVGLPCVFLLPHFLMLTPVQHLLLTLSLLLLPVGLWAEYSLLLLNSMGRFGALSIVRIIVPLTFFMILLLLWVTHEVTLLRVVLATWAGSWISVILVIFYLVRAGCDRFRPDFALLRRSLRYGAKVQVGNLANIANGRLDQLIMTAIVAPKALGLYAFAVTISEMLNQIASALSLVLMQKVAVQTTSEGQKTLSAMSARWVLIVGTLGAFVLWFVAPPLVSLLWGTRFLEAVPTLRVLLPGTVALGVAVTLCTGLRAANHPLPATYPALASLVVMTPLLFLFLPRWGIFGAGLASSLGYFAYCIVALIGFGRAFGWASIRDVRPTRQDWHDARLLIARLLFVRRPSVSQNKA